jgi:acetyl-CoA carboxylase biotin carboxyl carrier protein
MTLTEDEVNQILKLIEESSFNELHLEMGDLKLIVRKGGGATITSEELGTKTLSESVATEKSVKEVRARESENKVQKIEEETSTSPEEGLIAVKSPMLGIFYRCPAPGVPAYVEVGGFVKEDETVCLIEVMKVFNAVKAGISGTIEKICAESGQLVEYGQPLFFIRSEEGAAKREKDVEYFPRAGSQQR